MLSNQELLYDMKNPATTSAAGAGAGAPYVVIGGGIAGVSCARELSRLAPSAAITLVTASSQLKETTNYVRLSDTLEEFEVVER